jgi:hypothetical protein
MILELKIEVEGELEAYEVISELDVEHAITEAKLIEISGGKETVKITETFDAENPPVMFGKDNTKHAKQFRAFKE